MSLSKSNDNKTGSKSIDFPHFDIYYKTLYKDFNKPADPLVLFLHYLLIHNRFSIDNDGKRSSSLPDKWNESREYYDLVYSKHSVHYRLEIYMIGDYLHISFKRLSDLVDTLLHIRMFDYVEKTSFKNTSYEDNYKLLYQLYKRLQFSIDLLKPQKKPKHTITSSSSSVSSISNPLHLLNKSINTMNVDNTSFRYKEIVAQIKQETFDLEQETLCRRTSMTSSTSSHFTKSDESVKVDERPKVDELGKVDELPNPDESDRTEELPKADESNKSKKKDENRKTRKLFVDNPITNYIYYNRNVDRNIGVDENNIKNDEWICEQYKKYNLKMFSKVIVVDVMKTDDFKGKSTPIRLDPKLKEKYKLNSKRISLINSAEKVPASSKRKATKRKRSNDLSNLNRNKKNTQMTKINTFFVIDSNYLNSSSVKSLKSPPVTSKETSENNAENVEKEDTMDLTIIDNQQNESGSSASLPELDLTSNSNTSKNNQEPSQQNESAGIEAENLDETEKTYADGIFSNLKKSVINCIKTSAKPVPNITNKENNETDLEDRPSKRTKPTEKSPYPKKSIRELLKSTQQTNLSASQVVEEQNKPVNGTPASAYKRPTRNYTPIKMSIKTPEKSKSKKIIDLVESCDDQKSLPESPSSNGSSLNKTTCFGSPKTPSSRTIPMRVTPSKSCN